MCQLQVRVRGGREEGGENGRCRGMLVEPRDVLSRDKAESLSLTENQVLFARLGRGIEDVPEEALVLGGYPGEAHEQRERRRYHQAGLLPDLAVRGLFSGLAILNAAANEPPCVGEARGVSVAVLQQDASLGVNQEHKRGVMIPVPILIPMPSSLSERTKQWCA